MKDLNDIPEFLKYFRIIKPSEISINKEDIFYRDKYNDILNYLKAILTNHEDTQLNGYIIPRGAVLININPGMDILDYIRLITKNYYLELIEFNEIEILNAPNKFLKSFISILETFGKNLEKEDKIGGSERDPDSTTEKKILLINQKPIFKEKFDEINLLEVLLNAWQSIGFSFGFIESNVILVWLNYDIKDVSRISEKLYDIFDLFIKIPLLNKIERETVLKDFLERNSKIVFDINDIINYTENWEVKDIKQLLKVGIFRHFLNSELNETSNEITDILINLIVSGEFIPNTSAVVSEGNSNVELSENDIQNQPIVYHKESKKLVNVEEINNVIDGIRESRISDFMLNQLYEDAASKNYTELTIIIDKLHKKEPLEENDMKMLAQHPFILNDSPSKAQINLEKAKKRIDLIKQAFGK
ncbi:MAG: hypothetical protein JSV62_12465 [Promethearchaeota archaeon]|nr:MAG: hypothetical protein JSV62_12465 [Candidatus Lokiarchaeota archaeon]